MIDNNGQFANSPGDGKSAGTAGQALDRSGGVPQFPARKMAAGHPRNRAPLCTGGMAARFAAIKSFLHRAGRTGTGGNRSGWGRNGKRYRHRVGDGVRRVLARAVPTCNLWTYDARLDAFRFRLWPRFSIDATLVDDEVRS